MDSLKSTLIEISHREIFGSCSGCFLLFNVPRLSFFLAIEPFSYRIRLFPKSDFKEVIIVITNSPSFTIAIRSIRSFVHDSIMKINLSDPSCRSSVLSFSNKNAFFTIVINVFFKLSDYLSIWIVSHKFFCLQVLYVQFCLNLDIVFVHVFYTTFIKFNGLSNNMDIL